MSATYVGSTGDIIAPSALINVLVAHNIIHHHPSTSQRHHRQPKSINSHQLTKPLRIQVISLPSSSSCPLVETSRFPLKKRTKMSSWVSSVRDPVAALLPPLNPHTGIWEYPMLEKGPSAGGAKKAKVTDDDASTAARYFILFILCALRARAGWIHCDLQSSYP